MKAVGVLLVWLVVAGLVYYANLAGATGLALVAIAIAPMLLAIVVTVKILSSRSGS